MKTKTTTITRIKQRFTRKNKEKKKRRWKRKKKETNNQV